MNANPAVWGGGMLVVLMGLVGVIVVLAFMISVSGNLRAIRKESERQTGLLEQLAQAPSPKEGPRPKEDVAAKGSSILSEALQPQRVPRDLIIVGGILLIIILVAVALFYRH